MLCKPQAVSHAGRKVLYSTSSSCLLPLSSLLLWGALHFCMLDGSTHKRAQLCVVCGNGAESSGTQKAGEIADCALLHDNIVMLDYPSNSCRCLGSHWTHKRLEKPPVANGYVLGFFCWFFFFQLRAVVVGLRCSLVSHLTADDLIKPACALTRFDFCCPSYF